MMPFLPHAIVQLETGFICDLELIVGRIPYASRLIVQGKKIVAEGRDCWQGREKESHMSATPTAVLFRYLMIKLFKNE